MTTARDIIESALRKIQVLGRGQSLDADSAQNGLDALNQMIDSWSIESGGSIVFTETRESFPLTASQASYTIGSGGDFDTVKPYEILAMFVRVGETDYSLQSMDAKQYADISDKDLKSDYADYYYFDNNYPLSTITLYPVPSTGQTLHIYSLKALSNLTGLTTELAFPKGYERALIHNLAVELAPEYEKEAPATVYKIAMDSKKALSVFNTKNENNLSGIDYGLIGRGGFNIYTGDFDR